MKNQRKIVPVLLLVLGGLLSLQNRPFLNPEAFTRVAFRDQQTVTDLGVGLWAWPLPMDYDGDGDLDMVVSCPDTPFKGLYWFENKTGGEMPVFEAPVKIGEGFRNPQISYVNGKPVIFDKVIEIHNLGLATDEQAAPVYPLELLHADFKKTPRFTQVKQVDYDGDGDEDLIVGMDDWGDYGWDDAYDEAGNWTNGPLHGYVYLIENVNGTYADKRRIQAAGKDLDVYGAPSPNFADFDGDGDLDIICGEFLDAFTWFENTGTRSAPVYAAGKRLSNENGVIRMDLEMIIPVAIDWNNDGHVDLVVGDEDGRVAYMKNTGEKHNGMPVFKDPVYFQQKGGSLKFGALATPFSVDWDNDGDEDLIVGNSAGYLAFIENKGGSGTPDYAVPQLLKADGKTIRIQAGKNGSIQGPCEAKWGYTVLSVADWDGDGLKDIILNSIWGKIIWFRNTGTANSPKLAAAQPVKIDWPAGTIPKPAWNWWNPGPDELATQWRTTPYAIDWNKDGLTDLVMLDHEGYLAYFEGFTRNGERWLKPGQRIFCLDDENTLLRMNERKAGGSGRRKFVLADWDNDGDVDLIVNSVNADLLENIGTVDGKVIFRNKGSLNTHKLAGHTTSPTIVDWNKNGIPDLLLGAEDGHFYHLSR